MLTVDGLRATSPTRLCQENMLCIGRSNYLRFNHPAEANLMKKFLPNTRISMATPLNFFGNGDGIFEKKPPMPPTRRSRDSWELGNGNEDAKNKLDYFPEGQTKNIKSISPKVFPPGSATVNSPASAVLGHSRIPNGLISQSKNAENGSVDYIEPPVPQVISNFPQKASVSYSNHHHQNGFDETSEGGRVQSPKVLTLPSPAFNRNPSPYVPDKFRSITPNKFATRSLSPSANSRSVTPSLGQNKCAEDAARLMSRSHDSRISPSFTLGLNLSQEELNNRKDNLESKMFQGKSPWDATRTPT